MREQEPTSALPSPQPCDPLPERLRAGGDARLDTDWRGPLLRLMLRASGAGCLVAPLIPFAVAGVYHAEFLGIQAIGAALLALSYSRIASHRGLHVGFVVALSAATLLVMKRFAWTPTVVAGLSCVIVSVGLLIGRRWVHVVPVVTALLLLLGAAGVHAGLFSQPLTAEVDPRLALPWIRFGAVYAVLTGASVWTLREAVNAASRAEAGAQAALREVQTSLTALASASERRLREERALIDAQKLQTVAQLGDGFAHVVNNALTVVRCACEDLRRDAAPGTRAQAAQAIREATAACAAKTRELLALTRPHATPSEPLDLQEAVRDCLPRLRGRLRTNLRCRDELRPTGAVALSPSWVEQMLLNLVLNAEQAIPASGTIVVSTGRTTLERPSRTTVDRLPVGRYASLTVRDDGPGMAPDVAARACDPFFTTRSRAGHDGLGLTLLHRMARHLGGSLELSGGGPGTSVTVLIPEGVPGGKSQVPSSSPDPGITPTPSPAGPVPDPGEAARSAVVASAAPRPGRPSGSPRTGGSPATNSDHSTPSHREASTAMAPGGDTEEDWRVKALAKLLRSATIGWVVVTLVFVPFPLTGPLTVAKGAAILACVVLVVATTARRWSHAARLATLLLLPLVGGGLVVITNSYLSSTAIGLLSLAAFLGAIFGSRGIAVASFAGALLPFVLGSWLWSHGIVARPLDSYSGDAAWNWLRMAAVLPPAVTVLGLMVLAVFDVAQDRVERLVLARERLEATRQQQQHETEALLQVEAARGRTARSEAVGRLTGTVAHDLNNSLVGVLGWAELLAASSATVRRTEAIEGIEQSAAYAEALVQQLRCQVDVSHRGPSLDLGRAIPRSRPMLEAVLARRTAAPHGLVLSVEEGCHVAIDEQSLRRLLINLVTNARDAMGDQPGRCSVTVRRTAAGAELSVADTGRGMSSATRAQAFEAFFTTKPRKNTGLGLHSVAEIVRATDGTIDVSSEPGQGATFTIDWPLVAPATVPPPPVLPAPSPGTAARILLAEDEPLVRQLLARGLRIAGYDVVEAADGDVATSLLGSHGPFDALCVDAVMPGRPTRELLDAFAAAFPARPLILMSGYLPEDLSTHLGDRTDVLLLHKPFSPTQLLQSLGQPPDRP